MNRLYPFSIPTAIFLTIGDFVEAAGTFDKLTRRLLRVELVGSGPSDDDEVVGLELVRMMPEPLPHTPLDSCTLGRRADLFGRNDSQSWVVQIIPREDNHEVSACRAASVREDRVKLRTSQQPVRFREVRRGYFLYVVGARRLRPFARRRLITFRPPLVFIRLRKPWVRRRDVFEGWNVRFMMLLQIAVYGPTLKSLLPPQNRRKYAHEKGSVKRRMFAILVRISS